MLIGTNGIGNEAVLTNRIRSCKLDMGVFLRWPISLLNSVDKTKISITEMVP